MAAHISTPYKKLGAWVSRSKATVYQAISDGFVIAANLVDAADLTILTDGSDPPTTVRARTSNSAQCIGNTACTVVKKNDYWMVNCSAVITLLFWIPFGP